MVFSMMLVPLTLPSMYSGSSPTRILRTVVPRFATNPVPDKEPQIDDGKLETPPHYSREKQYPPIEKVELITCFSTILDIIPFSSIFK